MVKKTDVISKLDLCRILPIFSHEDNDMVVSVVRACYQGGCRAFEFTNRVANAERIFMDIKKHQADYPDMLIGVGTIMNKESAQRFIDLGADFIVSPILKTDIGKICMERDRVWIPGCATPTEIITAHESGADFIKLFPASTLGSPFVSAMLSVAPHLKFVVTGGIDPNEESIVKWLKVGVRSVGLGSNLLKKELLVNRDWNALAENVAQANRFGQNAGVEL